MAKYATTLVGVTATTNAATPIAAIAAAATGSGSVLGIHEISLSGEASSSTFIRGVLNRPSAVTIGSGPNTQVAQPLNPASAAAGYTAYVAANAYGTSTNACTPGSINLLCPAFNAFGGVYTWLAAPGGEIIIGGQGTSVASQNLIFYSLSGTPVISGHFIVEQY